MDLCTGGVLPVGSARSSSMARTGTSPQRTGGEWPYLREYDQGHLSRIALPLGGIGTGTISLGGRGDLRSWEIVNRAAKDFQPPISFFAIYARQSGAPPVTRIIEGLIEPEHYEGFWGSPNVLAGFPRFRRCSFRAAYPLGQVLLSDPAMPVDVRIEAFNPLVPGDADASGIPIAVVRFVILNRSAKPVSASICGTMTNFIGSDGKYQTASDNVNEFRESGRPRLRGLFMSSKDMDPEATQYGTMALATTGPGKVSHRTVWVEAFGRTLSDFWNEFSRNGKVTDPDTEGWRIPVASLAVPVRIPARTSRSVTFLIAWHFPNRRSWSKPETTVPENVLDRWNEVADTHARIGNFYSNCYTDAWDVAERTAAVLPKLEAKTVEFVRAFCDSDLPECVKEAALSKVSTLRTNTCFRTEDGNLYGWEGSLADTSCCYGSCNHVWNYEYVTPFLFGSLAKSMRDVELFYATDDKGLMHYRVNLPLERSCEFPYTAADGQMGALMKLYREWQLSGDDAMLKRLWPKARKALEFCWIPKGWDADRDGVMEGCQHNTMDIEFFGPNPEVGVWYLGALRACEEMARYLGDTEFAETCRDLFENGSAWIDEHLFNGEYYEHEIRPPKGDDSIADGLRFILGTTDLEKNTNQLGKGCLTDQLVGQVMAHVCGLGYLLRRPHVRRALRSVVRYNFRRDMFDHVNAGRATFALNDEPGMVVASYPHGERPEKPFPYHSGVWSGLEYTAAAGLAFEGQNDSVLKIVRATRSRFDGSKRNPFCETECGYHYVRSMASWALVLAYTGFRYSAVGKTVTFAARDGVHFWSNGYAWGTCRVKVTGGKARVKLKCLHGALPVKRFELQGFGCHNFNRTRVARRGRIVDCLIDRAA